MGHSYDGLLVTEVARRHPQRVRAIVQSDRARMRQRLAYKTADAERVQADDTALLAMLPPSMAQDYRVLVELLDAADAESVRAMPDVPVALLTATQVADEPFAFEETAADKVSGRRSTPCCSQPSRAACSAMWLRVTASRRRIPQRWCRPPERWPRCRSPRIVEQTWPPAVATASARRAICTLASAH